MVSWCLFPHRNSYWTVTAVPTHKFCFAESENLETRIKRVSWHKVKVLSFLQISPFNLGPSPAVVAANCLVWRNSCGMFFFFFYRNLLANVSWSQLSHKEHCEWHCHKIIGLEKVVLHSVAPWRKMLFIYSGPLFESISKLMQQNSEGVMFLNHLHSSVHSPDEFLWRFILHS